ncbi:hypothetical protein [Helicobacter pylori]
MLALAHLSKILSIDNQDPNAPLSDRFLRLFLLAFFVIFATF